MVTAIDSQAEFRALTNALKSCSGAEFETHAHPATLLDRVTGPAVQVWGWWALTAPRQLPCVMWCTERGWSVTAVEPDEIGSPGYELAHWSHRVKLLDLALANALGPHRNLGTLELYVAADSTLQLGPFGPQLKDEMLWGIVQQRAARSRAARKPSASHRGATQVAGRVDAELARYALLPTLAKKSPGSPKRRAHKVSAVDALVSALAEVRLTGGLANHE